MNYHPSVYKMWEDFTGLNPGFGDNSYTSWYFCNTENCANKLAELVKKGIKKGTTSLFYWYEKGEENLPKVNQFSIVTNWNGIARCIIRTKMIYILPFKKFTEELAFIEGEGDKSLEYWRKVHKEYFTEELRNQPVKFTENLKILFEEFEPVYPKKDL